MSPDQFLTIAIVLAVIAGNVVLIGWHVGTIAAELRRANERLAEQDRVAEAEAERRAFPFGRREQG